MRPCFHIEIETPKKVLLNGLWFGPKKPKRVFVWTHGLSSSVFGKSGVIDQLVSNNTAVLAFNNRGHDKISTAVTAAKKRIVAGAAHEVFTDCVDDIDGALAFARKQGVRNIFLAGASTGCQKNIYWASKNGRGIKGIVLFAPISDYTSERQEVGEQKLREVVGIARRYMKEGRKHALLPTSALGWSYIIDAQRAVSLYSGESSEEIFTYWKPETKPKTLTSVKIPLLVFLAEKDEFADRPATEIADWFLEHIYTGETIIVPDVSHSFKGAEKMVAQEIKDWMARV